MRRSPTRSFVALSILACLSFPLAGTSVAGKLKFPSDDPAFTCELPSGWTQTRDKNGNLSCDSHDDSGYNFSILLLDGVRSEKELKAALPQLANGAGLKNFKAGNVEDTENGNGLRFAEVKGRGEADGTPIVVVVTGFQPQSGRFYALLSVGTEEADKKHAGDYEANRRID